MVLVRIKKCQYGIPFRTVPLPELKLPMVLDGIRQTDTHLMASFPEQTGSYGIRKVKSILILMKQ